MIANAEALATSLKSGGLSIVSGGTDTHLILVDLRSKGITGRSAEAFRSGAAGSRATATAYRLISRSPSITSGIRLGTAAGTTRGFKNANFMSWVG